MELLSKTFVILYKWQRVNKLETGISLKLLSWNLQSLRFQMEKRVVVVFFVGLLFLALAARETAGQEREDGLEREGPPIVKTEEGEVEGFPTIYSGRPNFTVNVFLGIPYALPPLGVFRFAPPVPIIPWAGVLHVTRIPAACYQKPFPFQRFNPAIRKWSTLHPLSENCLTLNVWSPKAWVLSPVLLNVIVFIHGGGFMKGSSTQPIFDGLSLAALQNVVVVSFNYRLSSFGYLYLNHPGATGNAGLFDQLMALQWVQRNIKYFGGDPTKVTVVGHSAGAVSISYHLMSPLVNGLFSRAILLSGGPTAGWNFAEKQDALKLGERLSEESGCNDKNDKNNKTHVLKCLQSMSPEDLLNNEPGFGYDDVFVFKPVVDGIFLPDNPRKLLREGNFTKMDLLFGSVQDESSVFLPGQVPMYFQIRESKPYLRRDDFKEALGIVSQLQGLPLKLVDYEYTVWNDPEDGLANAQSIKDVFSDSYFNCAINEMAEAYADSGTTIYRTMFAHRSLGSLWPTWMGVAHGDDILYLFGEPIRPGLGYTPQEAQLSRMYMDIFVNFAKTGNPNNNDTTKFQPFTAKEKITTVIDLHGTRNLRYYKDRQCHLWNFILPEVLASL